MLRSASVLGLSVLASLTAGCFGLGGYSTSSGSFGGGPAAVSGALTVSNGVQAGDMGDIRGFDGEATRHSGSYDSYGANLRIDSEGAGWWVMSSIHVTGDLAGPSFAPGTHRVFTSATWDGSENVSVTGCSGPEYGRYTFDGPSDQVTIDIEDLGGGVRRMNFEAVFRGEVTSGSVDYRIDRTGGSTSPRDI